MVRIACIQVRADSVRDTTFAKIETLLKGAASKGVDVACFPELTVDQFFPQYFGQKKFFDLAEPLVLTMIPHQ
ncbi:MAG: hypothetical protein HXS46_06370 [Theionarchaea archaeon]|nr:MAG: hypothetical protein AYK18_11455 [Theionarchaea archaeon DG-70]MBU7010298.1 hypothetical protein [Theionarchaea archaeon]